MKPTHGFLLLEFLTTLLLISLFTFIIAQYQVMTIVWSKEALLYQEALNQLQAYCLQIQHNGNAKRQNNAIIITHETHNAPQPRNMSVYQIPSSVNDSFKIITARATYQAACKNKRTLSCVAGVYT